MYVDLGFLLLIYVFASVALFVSIYALWTLKEIEEFYKSRITKQRQQKQPLHTKPIKRPKGHWD